MRIILITFFASLIHTANAQNECWECLVAARNLDSKTALVRCMQADKNQKLEKNEKSVVSFVIGGLLLKDGNAEKALNYLKISGQSEDSLFRALSLGLTGDCYLEQDQPELALNNYIQAADLANNTLFTPYFLNKQGIVFRIQGKTAAFERIGSRLRVNHKDFFNALNLGNYYGKESSEYDAANRALLNNQLPSGAFGIGIINGKPADLRSFDKKFRQFEESYSYYPSYGMTLPSKDQIEEMAWNAVVIEQVVHTMENAFALGVNDREFHAYLFGENGYSVLPEINQAFSDDGFFDKEGLKKYISDQESVADSDLKTGWMETKRLIREQASQEKYRYLLGLGLYVTNKEASLSDEISKKTVRIRGVCFSADYFKNDTLPVSEKDLQAYFEKHKADPYYEYPAQRKLKYFKVPIASAASDSAAFLEELMELKKAFEETTSDSLFVIAHSDYPKVYASNHLATSLPASHERANGYFVHPDELDAAMVGAKPGTVIGPYEYEGSFRLAKVIGFNEQLLTVRHILISSPPADVSREENESKRKVAMDLAKKITDDNFADYVMRYSEDPGSKEEGGVYENFLDYEMVTPLILPGKPHYRKLQMQSGL